MRQRNAMRRAVVLAVAVLMVFAIPAFGEVDNGGFESPKIEGAGQWDLFANGTGGLIWTVEWTDATGCGGAGPFLEIQRGTVIPPFEGDQYAELDTDCETGPRTATNVRISQEVDTVEDYTYSLRFAWAARTSFDRMELNVPGRTEVYALGAPEPTTTGTWDHETVVFTADGPKATVSFEETGPADTLGMFLDAVSVQCEFAVFDLIADGPDTGFTLDIGNVYVWDDGDTLFVKVMTTGGWEFDEAHVHATTDAAGPFPTNKAGSPKVGKFFHNRSYDPWATMDVFEFELDGESGDMDIAVHLSAWDTNSIAMTTFASDGMADTWVTSTNTGMATPFVAVDAWEAFGDPADTGPSFWDSTLVYPDMFTFSAADWVWESYRVVDPNQTQTVGFEHTFAVPGPPVDGTVYIANDNTYEAWMNDAFLGDQTDYRMWPYVGKYSFMPVSGANVLAVSAANYGEGGGWTLDNNPAGLIYEGYARYYDRNETAWGSGEFFRERGDWSMKFTYTLGECLGF